MSRELALSVNPARLRHQEKFVSDKLCRRQGHTRAHCPLRRCATGRHWCRLRRLNFLLPDHSSRLKHKMVLWDTQRSLQMLPNTPQGSPTCHLRTGRSLLRIQASERATPIMGRTFWLDTLEAFAVPLRRRSRTPTHLYSILLDLYSRRKSQASRMACHITAEHQEVCRVPPSSATLDTMRRWLRALPQEWNLQDSMILRTWD